MRVSELEIDYELQEVFILDYGYFYFFDGFIVSEIREGVLFNWEAAQEVIELAYIHYGEGSNIAYISNRVFSYSIVPQDWLKFFTARHSIKGMAVVTYTKESALNVLVEKLFFSSKIRKFTNLVEAIEWGVALEATQETGLQSLK